MLVNSTVAWFGRILSQLKFLMNRQCPTELIQFPVFSCFEALLLLHAQNEIDGLG
ncbi:uncharacterized protein PHALS_07648 [Plasmopara halstedii]|uniref:Uncharacterized protein n=1 Tax=Plasmopara halstedii TaxID=4781 RepID=A0A0P1B559_PLAHL|nr:uncharacterized protein PHALS_07648 [Plasmopara halstedii]CEG49912.1 hypothetical protein PHALS_07648 [Plasmopara halstedii]|eukprot:XP_024586281.1 hypothetical protein PHALS_07648 [Plasmopara halstedii]